MAVANPSTVYKLLNVIRDCHRVVPMIQCCATGSSALN